MNFFSHVQVCFTFSFKFTKCARRLLGSAWGIRKQAQLRRKFELSAMVIA